MDILPSSDKNLKQTPLLIFAKVIICDIEGTTTSINFVKEILFEYASSHVKKFLKRNWKEKPVKKVVLDLISECGADLKNNSKGAINLTDDDFVKKERKDKIKMIAKSVKWLIKKDRKVASLKTLQGMIWKEGFVNGILKGHIYDDVPIAFEKWVDVGAKIYIYSSGSEHAQKLLYTYSKFGNLLPKISGHFDIGIGMKNESNSYKNILTKIGVNAKYVLFLTDSVQEARAAKKADISVILLDRPGNADYTDEIRTEFKIIKAFDNIEILNYKKGMKKDGQKVEEGNKDENRELEKQAEENAVEEKLIEENVMKQVEKGEINFDDGINGDAMKQIVQQNQTKNILDLEENKELLKNEREEKRREKKAYKKMKAEKKKAEKREERHLKKEEKKKKKQENNKLEIKQEENLSERPEVMIDEANIEMQNTQIQDEKFKNEMVVENKEQKEGDIEEETRGEGKSKNEKKKEVKNKESEIIKENMTQKEEWKETNNMNQNEKEQRETKSIEWKEQTLVKDSEMEEIHYELENKDAEENLQQKEQKIKGKKNKKKKKVKDQLENKTEEQDVEMEDLTIK